MYCQILWNAFETAYGREINIQFTGNSSGGPFLQSACQLQAPSKLATSVALCCVIKLHILEWPFIVASLRHTCVIIMLTNQHLDMPHLWGGWIISAKEKCSLKPYSDGNCFSWGRKWFSPDTGGSWWFNCRPNPGCRCFSLTTPVKIPGRITYCFLTNTEVVWLINCRPNPHLWVYEKKSIQNSVFNPFWALPNTVTLYFGVIYILFLKCWKVFKRTILHDCSTTATGSRKEEKHINFQMGLYYGSSRYNTILKCVL